MAGNINTRSPTGGVVVFENEAGKFEMDIKPNRTTVWLNQRQMAEVFRTSAEYLGLHLKNTYAERELKEATTTEEFPAVQTGFSHSGRT